MMITLGKALDNPNDRDIKTLYPKLGCPPSRISIHNDSLRYEGNRYSFRMLYLCVCACCHDLTGVAFSSDTKLNLLAQALGVKYTPSPLYLVDIDILFCLVYDLRLKITVSKLIDRTTRLTQEIATLREQAQRDPTNKS